MMPLTINNMGPQLFNCTTMLLRSKTKQRRPCFITFIKINYRTRTTGYHSAVPADSRGGQHLKININFYFYRKQVTTFTNIFIYQRLNLRSVLQESRKQVTTFTNIFIYQRLNLRSVLQESRKQVTTFTNIFIYQRLILHYLLQKNISI